MKITQLVRAFRPLMQKHGFSMKNHRYYTVENNLYFGLSFDCPGGLVYCTAYVIPLWLSCDAEIYTYGNRIHAMKHCGIPPFRLDSRDDAAEQWVSGVAGFLEQRIFPFFSSVSSPECFVRFLRNSGHGPHDFFFCSEIEWNRLVVYTDLCTGALDDLPEKIENAKETLSASAYLTDAVKERDLQELSEIAALAALNDPKRAAMFCSETIAHTSASLQNSPSNLRPGG